MKNEKNMISDTKHTGYDIHFYFTSFIFHIIYLSLQLETAKIRLIVFLGQLETAKIRLIVFLGQLETAKIHLIVFLGQLETITLTLTMMATFWEKQNIRRRMLGVRGRLLSPLAAFMAILVMLPACNSKYEKTGTGETDTQSELASKDAVNTMNDFNLDGNVEVDGRKYDYEFAFEADRHLPVVITTDGYRYYDNHVKLIISQGNHTVVEHTFTKQSFEGLIPGRDYKHSVLAGFNRNYMKQDKHDRFYFVAVVGDPDESGDINHTVGISIDTDGHISTSLLQNVDTDPTPESGTNPNGSIEADGRKYADPEEDAA